MASDLDETLSSIEVTEEIVKAELLKLNENKSPGPDGISPRLLKQLHAVLSKPIAIIFRKSLTTSTVPQDWKQANISAIHKKGNRKSPSNYRPVSLTSVICNVLERIIRDSITSHMKTNGLFSNKQFGFLSGRSTTLQLLKVLDNWTEILDEGGSIDAVYMDFMKAFDKVPHRRLLTKIHHYGIQGDLRAWICQYLSNRQQRVGINGTYSDWQDVLSGIPQGSVLGPLLFVIYINDLPEILSEGTEAFLFADDTKIFRRILGIEDCHAIQSDLNRLLDWSQKWLLMFHPDKCKVLELGGRQDRNYKYTMDGTLLEHVESEKDIGVEIDNKLKFNKHVSNKVNKANTVLGVIRRSFKHLDPPTFTTLFKSLVRPILEYANPVWSPHLKKDILAIENVQRRATKLLPGFKDLTYTERLQRLKLPTLVYRRLRGDVIEVYKLLNQKYDEAVAKGLLSLHSEHCEKPTRNRGHKQKLFKRRARLNLRQKFFSFRVVDVWNSLPTSVIEAPSVLSFERRLDKCWRKQDLLYNFKAVFNKSRSKPAGSGDNDTTDEDLDI